MSRREIKNKIEKNLLFFFNFQKIGLGGSVKQKIKKLWPKKLRRQVDSLQNLLSEDKYKGFSEIT